MTKAMAFAKLDFMTVKSYLSPKNLALMIVAPLFIMVSMGVNSSSGAVFMFFSALYVSYPFIICEKNGMDALYTTLSISRTSVVLGRYLFSLALSVCAGLIGMVFTVAITVVTSKTVAISEALLTTLALFAVVSIVEAIQLPIYFKLGYEKAKILAFLPYMIMGLAGIGYTKLFPQGSGLAEHMLANTHPYIIASVAVWILIIVSSYRLSIAFYKRREF